MGAENSPDGATGAAGIGAAGEGAAGAGVGTGAAAGASVATPGFTVVAATAGTGAEGAAAATAGFADATDTTGTDTDGAAVAVVFAIAGTTSGIAARREATIALPISAFCRFAFIFLLLHSRLDTDQQNLVAFSHGYGKFRRSKKFDQDLGACTRSRVDTVISFTRSEGGVWCVS